MNKRIYIKTAAFFACMAIFMTSCNNSDDLNEIFQNNTWKLSFFREGTSNTAVKGDYNVKFYDNSFTATTPSGAAISGMWKADNKSRTFNCTNIRVSNGNIGNDTTAIKMKTFFEKATTYQGDANYLQIKQQNNVFMQFHNR